MNICVDGCLLESVINVEKRGLGPAEGLTSGEIVYKLFLVFIKRVKKNVNK